jgi:hypothetical protein
MANHPKNFARFNLQIDISQSWDIAFSSAIALADFPKLNGCSVSTRSTRIHVYRLIGKPVGIVVHTQSSPSRKRPIAAIKRDEGKRVDRIVSTSGERGAVGLHVYL